MDHYHGYQYELNSNQQLDREGIRRGDLKKKREVSDTKECSIQVNDERTPFQRRSMKAFNCEWVLMVMS